MNLKGIGVCCSLLLAGLSLGSATEGRAETFRFGGFQNGFGPTDQSATLQAGAFQMQLSTVLPGSYLNEPQGAGMGINSQSAVNIGSPTNEPNPALFNQIESGPLAGKGEAVRFRFDRAGVLTGLDFDGVADERLEYFTLQTAGVRINFFDSAANGPIPFPDDSTPDPSDLVYIPGFVDKALDLKYISDAVVYLDEIPGADDKTDDLWIPFVAGQEFTLTYRELDDVFGTHERANGGRLQGITVAQVPEPSSLLCLCWGAIGVLGLSRPRSQRLFLARFCRNRRFRTFVTQF